MIHAKFDKLHFKKFKIKNIKHNEISPMRISFPDFVKKAWDFIDNGGLRWR